MVASFVCFYSGRQCFEVRAGYDVDHAVLAYVAHRVLESDDALVIYAAPVAAQLAAYSF